MLSVSEIEDLPLPRMPDRKACYPTTLAFSLAILGRPITPRKVSEAMARPEGQGTGTIEEARALLWVMSQGLKVQKKVVEKGLNFGPFLDPAREVTFQEFQAHARKKVGRRAARHVTQAIFDELRRVEREYGPAFEAHTKAGCFTYDLVQPIDVTSLKAAVETKNAVILCNVTDGPKSPVHAISLFDPSEEGPYCFNPLFTGSWLGRLSLDHIVKKLVPGQDLTIIHE